MSNLNLRLPPRAWVVVCDGAKALIFENIGDADYPDLRMRLAEEQPDRRTQELGTDAPGRAFSTVGSARSAVGQTDWHDQSETRFLTDLVATLDKAVQAGEVSGLVIVAPPRALGAMRKAYSAHVRKAVLAEVERQADDVEDRGHAGTASASAVLPARCRRNAAAAAPGPLSESRTRMNRVMRRESAVRAAVQDPW